LNDETVPTHADEDAGRAATADEPREAAAPGAAPGKPLSPAAERALKEAAERRAALDAKAAELAAVAEVQGRGGLDPVRYDDWEIKGLTADF
jgi:hypothetical protein